MTSDSTASNDASSESAVLISLIVPIYNVSDYLRAALESVYRQLPPDCELVCVDDGSTDESMTVLETLGAEFPEGSARTTVVQQANQGLSGARNTGLDVAEGRYIGFLDPDDWLLPGYFDTLRHAIDAHGDVSIICFNARRVRFEQGRAPVEDALAVHPGTMTIDPSNSSDFEKLAGCFARGRWFSWARLYARELFDIERFTPRLRYQDMMLLPLLYASAGRIVNIDSPLVAYRVHENSVTSRASRQTLSDLDRIIDRYTEAVTNTADARVAALYELVALSALESYFHAAKRLYPRSRAIREFRRRQADYGYRRLAMALFAHRHRQDWFAASMHLSPWLHLGLNAARRRMPFSRNAS